MFDRVNLWKILHSIYLFYEYLTQTVGYIPAIPDSLQLRQESRSWSPYAHPYYLQNSVPLLPAVPVSSEIRLSLIHI